jgi:hypothetical protein
VIKIVVSGDGMTRMKQMRARMHLVLEAVKEYQIEIKYKGTKEIIADGFAKSLDGTSFVQFRLEVLHLTD